MSDRLLSGLVHDFRGRATTFRGLGRLLGDEDTEPEWFRGHFEDELERLEETMELLSLLRGDPEREPEPLSLLEALPTILDLWSRRSGQPLPVELEHDGQAPPIRVSWPGFRRAFLIVLDEADGRARASGAARLGLELRGEGDEARLDVVWEEEAGGEPEEDRDRIPALAEVFQALGGRLAAPAGEPRIEARFPSLGAG